MAKYTFNGRDYYFPEENLTEDQLRKKVEDLSKPLSESDDLEGAGTYEDPKYEGFFTEAGEGVFSGVLGIFQGIGELGALGVDLIADTSYAEEVEKGFNDFRNKLGIDKTYFHVSDPDCYKHLGQQCDCPVSSEEYNTESIRHINMIIHLTITKLILLRFILY